MLVLFLKAACSPPYLVLQKHDQLLRYNPIKTDLFEAFVCAVSGLCDSYWQAGRLSSCRLS